MEKKRKREEGWDLREVENLLDFPFDLRLRIVECIFSLSLLEYVEKSERARANGVMLDEKKALEEEEKERELKEKRKLLRKEGLPCLPSPFFFKKEIISSFSSLICVNRSWYQFSQTPRNFFSVLSFLFSLSSFILFSFLLFSFLCSLNLFSFSL